MDIAYRLAKPLLRTLDAEVAHALTLSALKTAGKWLGTGTPVDNPVQIAGLSFPNRVGLAAGFDKNGEAIVGLSRLGFGFIEIGAVTPRPQAGNSKPRLFRLAHEHAVINSMGFNNDGVEAIRDRLTAAPTLAPTLLGANIGMNRDTPVEQAYDDFVRCMMELRNLVDFLTVNISSPNTPQVRALQSHQGLAETLRSLTTELKRTGDANQATPPIFVKLSPDTDPVLLRDLAIRIKESGCAGLIATNTTTQRFGLSGRIAKQSGGLSGKPLLRLSLHCVEICRDAVGSDYPVVGVGGIFSAQDAIDMRRAGADLVQVYTGLVFRGPGLIHELASAMT